MHEGLADRIHRLEESRSRWRLAALCILSGAVGVVVGGMAAEPSRPMLQAMVLDKGNNSGAFASTFYAVDAKGSIQYLDTRTGKGVWTPFQYSPSQGK
jgi:zinc transporter ZupT